ncbi:MAG: aldehyde dehydrogenase [Lachnospiraceae bacterium]|nr:aldehyde dehydrogenase [Lachnospiraceae bacterium]
MFDKSCGIFENTEEAVFASKKAQSAFSSFSVRERNDLIRELSEKLLKHVSELAAMEREESGMGIYEDKVIQITRAISGTPGASMITQEAVSDDEGLFLDESFSYGVSCAIHPINHPVASIINCNMMLLSAGNSVINLLPRRAENVSQYITKLIQSYLYDICGIANLAVAMKESRYENNKAIMEHPDVALIVVTGGNEIVKKTLTLNKRVIAAGEANPVVIVDAPCDLSYAARMIAADVAFDNNLLCTSEKAAVVLNDVFLDFQQRLMTEGVCILRSHEADNLMNLMFDCELNLRREYIGKDAADILAAIGIHVNSAYPVKAIAFETEVISPFVIQEVAAPILPLVRADSFEEAVLLAKYIEQDRNHTASIFSNDIKHLSVASRALRTSVFVKNGSTLYGAGIMGNSPVTFIIANVTGEGVVNPRHFVKNRKCILVNSFERE